MGSQTVACPGRINTEKSGTEGSLKGYILIHGSVPKVGRSLYSKLTSTRGHPPQKKNFVETVSQPDNSSFPYPTGLDSQNTP